METSLLFYLRPSNPSWSVVGAGAQFESDVRLSDGNPGVATALRWLSSGSPVVGDYVGLREEWSGPIVPRGAWLLGLTLESGAFPAGVKFEVRGKRVADVGFTYALGGNALTAVSMEQPDGSMAVLFAFDDGLDPIVGIEIRIYNDISGATWATADTYVRIGEGDVSEGIALCIAHGWRNGLEVRTQAERTIGSQLHEVERVNYRTLEFAMVPTDAADVRGGGLANDMDWQRVQLILARYNARVMVYVLTNDTAGDFSPAILHANAIFGRATPQPIVHVQNSQALYTSGWRVDEVPPIV